MRTAEEYRKAAILAAVKKIFGNMEGLAALIMLNDAPEGLTLWELAQLSDEPKSQSYWSKILIALEEAGFAEAEKSGRVRAENKRRITETGRRAALLAAEITRIIYGGTAAPVKTEPVRAENESAVIFPNSDNGIEQNLNSKSQVQNSENAIRESAIPVSQNGIETGSPLMDLGREELEQIEAEPITGKDNIAPQAAEMTESERMIAAEAAKAERKTQEARREKPAEPVQGGDMELTGLLPDAPAKEELKRDEPTEAEIEELRVLAESEQEAIFVSEFPKVFKTKASKGSVAAIKSKIMEKADRYSGKKMNPETKKTANAWIKGKAAHDAKKAAENV